MGCCICDEVPYETYKKVESRMKEIMWGWFWMLEETMDPYGPEPAIMEIASIVDETGRPIDDVIHEEMYEDWFQYHDDYEDDW